MYLFIKVSAANLPPNKPTSAFNKIRYRNIFGEVDQNELKHLNFLLVLKVSSGKFAQLEYYSELKDPDPGGRLEVGEKNA